MQNITRINRVKQLVTLFTVVILLVSLIPIQGLAEEKTIIFSDLGTNHWAYDEVYELVEQGVINGHPDGTFRPNEPVQVDQMLKMIIMVLSEEKEDGTRWWKDEFLSKSNSFTTHVLYEGSPGFDFKPEKNGYWAKPFINQAQNMGIVMRYDRWGGQFGSALTRKDVAYILVSTIGIFEELEESNYVNLARTQIKDLHKLEENGDMYSILQVYTKGLMRGYSDGRFGVDRVVTRAEAVVMLNRILDESKRDPYLPDLSPYPHAEVPTLHGETKMVVFPDEPMKEAYDILLENRNKSEGITEHADMWVSMIYYKDENQYNQEVQRSESVNGLFKGPYLDVQVQFETGANGYEVSISTENGAWERHKEAITHFIESVFGTDSDKFIKQIEEYIPKAKQGEVTKNEYMFKGLKTIFEASLNRDFIYINILKQR
jgi:hypothetical protein